MLSNYIIVLTGDSKGVTNRVLLANAGYVAVAGTQYSSAKIDVNKEYNSLNLTFWNNTISSGDAGTASDVRSGIVSLSASNTAIYAGTDSGIVLRYNLEDNFSYKLSTSQHDGHYFKGFSNSTRKLYLYAGYNFSMSGGRIASTN